MSKPRALAVLLGTLVLLSIGMSGVGAADTATPKILSLKLNGVVDPFMASYVKRGISTANSDGDAAVLLTIDTPGGLDSSMREIVKAILASNVPVICYTAPPGARAASAGTFIMLSCPINAMAAGTNIGAAHPVGVSGAIENEKVTNDATAFIRSLAARWHRNADWAEQAVRQAVSVSATEALTIHVVDYLAANDTSLFQQIGQCPGQASNLTPGTGLGAVPAVCGAAVVPFGMSLSEGLFHSFADPNVAFLLLNIGFLALIAWIFHPGFHVSLAVGIISIVVAFAILETLPVELTGVLLLLVAAVLFVVDVKAHAHGVLTAGGIAVLILGGLLLFNPTVPSARVSWPVLVIVSVAAGSFAAFLLRGLISARNAPVIMGVEGLQGHTGIAETALEPKGRVRARGETWTAVSTGGSIPKSATVLITNVRGVSLLVEREPSDGSDRASEPSPAGTSAGPKEGGSE